MTLARLLIRLEVDDSNLAKALDKSVTKLESFTDAASRLGRTLLLGATLPLALMAGSAISAAADMDSLRKAMDTVTGSSAETAIQIERLGELAKSPGLGFREVIQGSVNLQAVGFAATDAERAMRAFGNAIATTGGRKADFERVLFQLTQMAAVGKVLGADLRPIIQTAPAVAKALNELFGTTNAESIAEQTGSFREFFELLIPKLEEMGQVSGGAANTLDNFSDAVFKARTEIGEKLLPAILPMVEGFSRFLEQVEDLNPEVVNSGIAIAAVTALAGPAILAITGIATAVGTLSIAINVGLLPLLAIGGVLLLGLGALAKRFIENKLAALQAIPEIDRFAASLAGLNHEQVRALALENRVRDKNLRAMPQTDFIREALGQNNAEFTTLTKLFNDLWQAANNSPDRGNGARDLEALREGLKDAGTEARRYISALGDALPNTELFVQAQRAAMGALTNANARMRAQRDQLGEIAQGYRDIAHDIREVLVSSLGGVTPNIIGKSIDARTETQFKTELKATLELTPLELNASVGTLTNNTRLYNAALLETLISTNQFRENLLIAGQQLIQQFTQPRDTADQALNLVGDAALGVAQKLSPLGVVAFFLFTIIDELAPAVDALLSPIAILAKAFMPALMAILEALFPVFKSVAIAATFVGQVFFTAGAAIGKLFAAVLIGVGNLLNKLPGSLGNPLLRLGNQIQTVAIGYAESAKALGEARAEIQNLTWDTALDNATNGLEKLNQAVLGAVEGFKIAAIRQAATTAQAVVPSRPSVPIGGGTSSSVGSSGANVIVQGATFAPVLQFPAGDSGAQTYRVFYEELAIKVRGRGPEDPARLFWESLPSPS